MRKRKIKSGFASTKVNFGPYSDAVLPDSYLQVKPCPPASRIDQKRGRKEYATIVSNFKQGRSARQNSTEPLKQIAPINFGAQKYCICNGKELKQKNARGRGGGDHFIAEVLVISRGNNQRRRR